MENKPIDTTQRYKLDPYNHKVYTLDEYIADCYGGLPNEAMLEEQWNELPDVTIGYDSQAETLKHIRRVSQLLTEASIELMSRGCVHDDSKLEEPEKSLFDEYTPKLAGVEYGSEKYKEFLKGLEVALDHHYANNSHHPQHYTNGINGMNLFDLVEMFFDWKAATERTKNGNIYKSIDFNKARFEMSDQLAEIFKNTADYMGYEEDNN